MSYMIGLTSIPILMDGVNKFKQDVVKHKLQYS